VVTMETTSYITWVVTMETTSHITWVVTMEIEVLNLGFHFYHKKQTHENVDITSKICVAIFTDTVCH